MQELITSDDDDFCKAPKKPKLESPLQVASTQDTNECPICLEIWTSVNPVNY